MWRMLCAFGRGLVAVAALGPLAACGVPPPAAAQLGVGAAVEHGIIDGRRSAAGDYPATGVLLFTTQRDDGSELGSMLCSGTLIEPDVVMVAGHCNLSLFGIDSPIDYYFSLSDDVADFGEDDDLALPPRSTHVAHMLPHPQFSLNRVGPGLRRTNDLALMFLDAPVTEVAPAPLVTAAQARLLRPGREVAIVGYGRRHEARRPDDSGIKYHGLTRINEVGRYEMQVSPGAPQPHKCHGDSGGPTYLRVGHGRSSQLALVGITSHAYDDEDCRHGGVDTRIDPYLGWVRQSLAAACADGRRPACPAAEVALLAR